MALVKDGTALRYYLDGMPAASAMLEFDMPELPLFVGGDPQVGEFIEGAVDELRVYKRGLNKAEVSRLLKKESIADGLFFHHALDDVK